MPLININPNQNIKTSPQADVPNGNNLLVDKTNKLNDNLPLQQNISVTTSSEGIKEFNNPVQEVEPQVSDPSQGLDQRISNLSSELSKHNNSNLENSTGITNNASTSPELNISQMPDINFEEVLKRAIAEEASDVHITVGHRPIVRIDGRLKTLNFKIISSQDAEDMARQIVENRKNILVEDLKQIDLSYTMLERRFRVNIFRTMGDISIVMRLIPKKILSIDELELPQILKELSKVPAGLVLLTGPTGSGKSTTLAAVLNYINTTRAEHIITLEDPIEFVFPKGQSLIDQRELGQDFNEWPDALKAILRQDPNVVLVGEMRDHETISSTVTVSETGHLVFATLHTNSASQTIDRIIDVFPEAQQSQIRAQLAQVLTAVIGQRLVPLPGGGRKAVHEIMIATPAVKNAIREGQTHQIDNMIQTGQDYGMSTMESDLVELIRQGLISVQTAKEISIRPEELDILLSQV